MPGQRIWWQKLDGTAKPVTSGPEDTADYYPYVSPDSRELFYLRLDRRDSGSLYWQSLNGGQAVELIRNINGWPGYYGNYYPAWISVYHLDKTTMSGNKGAVHTRERSWVAVIGGHQEDKLTLYGSLIGNIPAAAVART